MTNCIVCENQRNDELIFLKNLPLIPGCFDKKLSSFNSDLRLLFCRKCGLIFKKRSSEELFINKKNYPYPRTSISRKRNEDKDFADFLKRNVKGSGKILDVGCHDGYFLNILGRDGWQTYGCEPSAYAKIARSAYNIKIYNKPFNVSHYRKNSFRLISLRNILNIIDNPVGLIEDCYSLLLDKGYLAIENINVNSWLNLETFSFSHQLKYYFHLNHFRYILEVLGYKVEKMQSGYRNYILARKSTFFPRKKSNIKFKVDRRLDEFPELYQNKVDNFKNEFNDLFIDWKLHNYKIAIFGAGSHTQFLMALLGLRSKDISHLVDNDSFKIGKTLINTSLKVENASVLKENNIDVIIVSAFPYQNEIIKFLKSIKVQSKIVKIYPKLSYV